MDRQALIARPATKRRTALWAIAVIAAGTVGAIAAGTAAMVADRHSPVRAIAALPAPADLDHAHHAFDAFRDQPPQPGVGSTASVAAQEGGSRL